MNGIDKTLIVKRRVSLSAPDELPPAKTRRLTFALEIKCEDDELEVTLSEVNQHAPLVPLRRLPAPPPTSPELTTAKMTGVVDELPDELPEPTAPAKADVVDDLRVVLDRVLDDVVDEARFRAGLKIGERRTSSQYGDEGVELDVEITEEPSDFSYSTHDDDSRDWTVTTGELSYNGDTRLDL